MSAFDDGLLFLENIPSTFYKLFVCKAVYADSHGKSHPVYGLCILSGTAFEKYPTSTLQLYHVYCCLTMIIKATRTCTMYVFVKTTLERKRTTGI